MGCWCFSVRGAGTVDLNSIPDNVIQRIEILQDGASAIYGSDAIGGVVNIITNSTYEGFRVDVQSGEYLSDNDGGSARVSALWGGGNDTSHFIFSLSFADEKGIDTSDRKRSAFPNPNATSCDVPGTFCSSFTPQARIVLGPNFGFLQPILNDGVLNDGGANIPDFDFADPFGGDFHPWSNADRFNYNGPGRNFLRTPKQRTNVYASVTPQSVRRFPIVCRLTSLVARVLMEQVPSRLTCLTLLPTPSVISVSKR